MWIDHVPPSSLKKYLIGVRKITNKTDTTYIVREKQMKISIINVDPIYIKENQPPEHLNGNTFSSTLTSLDPDLSWCLISLAKSKDHPVCYYFFFLKSLFY